MCLSPEIMQIARKRTLVKRRRDNGVTALDDVRQGTGLQLYFGYPVWHDKTGDLS